MKTLLKLYEQDNGKLCVQSASCPLPADYNHQIEQIVSALRDASWNAQIWASLFGIAQQMLDLGMVPRSSEPDDYYYDEDYREEPEEEHWESEDRLWAQVRETPRPEDNPAWQEKKTALQAELKKWRQETALRKGINDWDVIKHTVLEGIAKAMPTTQKELMNVRGFGELTYTRYGEEILSIVQKAITLQADTEGEEPAGDAGEEQAGAGR